MGKYDSTRTRVTPVFDHLKTLREPWLERLLTLPSSGHSISLEWHRPTSRVDEVRYGSDEKPLPAPLALLTWLTSNARDVTGKGLHGISTHSTEKRRRLLKRDPETIAEANELLKSSRADKRWFVLEGKSCADVFVSTPEMIVVIEGKRTEAGPTTSTKWMSPRHQMLRHMDGALEMAAGRTVLGFFIVEGDDDHAPALWTQAAKDTVAPETLEASLPHRSAAERELIARGFLGVTTWTMVCREFGIDPRSLPDTV